MTDINPRLKKGENTASASAPAEYIVGAEATFAPFEYQNEQKEIIGFDVGSAAVGLYSLIRLNDIRS